MLPNDKLSPLDTDHYETLADLGIDKHTADEALLQVISHSEAMTLMGFSQRDIEISGTEPGRQAIGCHEGLYIPYVNPVTGEAYGWCIRRSRPQYERRGNGKFREQRLTRSHHGLYFVPGTQQASLKDSAITIVLTFGELMALAWARFFRQINSNIVVIGLQRPGALSADHASQRGVHLNRELAPMAEFEGIEWSGRRVFLGLTGSSNVEVGIVKRLIRTLRVRGVMVEESLLMVHPAFYWDPSKMPRLPNDITHFSAGDPEILTSPWQ